MGTQLRTMLAAALIGAAPAVCHSEGFSVSPVRLHLDARDRSIALRLGNQGPQEVRLRAELYAWSQDELGRDQLTPSDDLVVSPPLPRVPARGEQVVRLILTVPRDPNRQMTYRLLLREEREPTQESAQAVPIALVLSLPLFITPASARHALECSVESDPAQQPSVHCHNAGRAHARVSRIDLKSGDTVMGRYEGNLYVLPGSRLRIPMATKPSIFEGSSWELQAQLDGSEMRRWLSREPDSARNQ